MDDIPIYWKDFLDQVVSGRDDRICSYVLDKRLRHDDYADINEQKEARDTLLSFLRTFRGKIEKIGLPVCTDNCYVNSLLQKEGFISLSADRNITLKYRESLSTLNGEIYSSLRDILAMCISVVFSHIKMDYLAYEPFSGVQTVFAAAWHTHYAIESGRLGTFMWKRKTKGLALATLFLQRFGEHIDNLGRYKTGRPGFISVHKTAAIAAQSILNTNSGYHEKHGMSAITLPWKFGTLPRVTHGDIICAMINAYDFIEENKNGLRK